MDFFGAQDLSRRRSRRLVALFILATLLIVVAVTGVIALVLAAGGNTLGWLMDDPVRWAQRHRGELLFTAIATFAVIAIASLYRTAKLSAGGGEIARQLGGTEVPPDVQDPQRRRLRNIVEEMALASGVPVPEVYVLEAEPGINAFAAGFNPSDAAVAVTRGALEQLDRDELQGVVAHEFSHILNGDMRLNLRLMGLLFGILVIGMVGRLMLHGGRVGALRASVGSRGRGGNNGAVAFVIIAGLLLVIIGAIGVLFGRLIRAGISRQREYLADASAVQFTRNNRGIAGALKKIGGYEAGSHFVAADGEEVSHMLFARGAGAFRNMLATHPPLEARIRALDPAFDSGRGDARPAAGSSRTAHAGAAGFATGAGGVAAGGAQPAAPGAHGFAGSDGGSVAATAGEITAAHVAHAHALRESLPVDLDDAAHSREAAPLLVLALMLHRDVSVRERQQRLLEQQLGAARAARTMTLGEHADAWRHARLELLELAFPAFRERPAKERRFHLQLAERLAGVDGELALFEYTLMRLLALYVDELDAPARAHQRRIGAKRAIALAHELLCIVAGTERADQALAERAYDAGHSRWRAALGARAALPGYRAIADWPVVLDNALADAADLPGRVKRPLVEALAAAVAVERRPGREGAELLRVVCAAAGVPLPPLLQADADTQSAPATG